MSAKGKHAVRWLMLWGIATVTWGTGWERLDEKMPGVAEPGLPVVLITLGAILFFHLGALGERGPKREDQA